MSVHVHCVSVGVCECACVMSVCEYVCGVCISCIEVEQVCILHTYIRTYMLCACERLHFFPCRYSNASLNLLTS